jgi:hypothetical protein
VLLVQFGQLFDLLRDLSLPLIWLAGRVRRLGLCR